MYDEPVGSDVGLRADVKIALPDGGTIRIESARLFAEADGMLCRRFVSRAFLAPEIDSAVITGSATAEGIRPQLRYDSMPRKCSPRQVLEHVVALLDAAASCDAVVEVPSAQTLRDQRGAVHYHHCGQRVTGWWVTSERIGAILA